MALTPEERKEHIREAKRRYAQKKKALKNLETAPNYEDLYKKTLAEIEAYKTKCAELEKMCKSYAEVAQQNKQLLQKATVEYTARINYMLDCVRHAYVSMEFAQNAADKKGE